jgi:molybdopterin-containing oxidoreductase family iron-sulfur binding subunit
MTASRRDFLKIAGASALTLLAPSIFVPTWAEDAMVIPPGRAYGPTPALSARRWAMAVDLARCTTDCTDCIAACHAVHNVPNFSNSKDDVKWIWTEPFTAVFPAENHPYSGQALQKLKVPVLCNHCDNPPCVRVCPTGATFARPDGIVMMDYHRCIGCRLCMAACPYGARSMNYRDPRPGISAINQNFPTRAKGVVEKCNFCEERLAKGIPPACVAACRQKALVFGDVEDPRSDIRLLLEKRFSLRRRAHLGTGPQIYYLL